MCLDLKAVSSTGEQCSFCHPLIAPLMQGGSGRPGLLTTSSPFEYESHRTKFLLGAVDR